MKTNRIQFYANKARQTITKTIKFKEEKQKTKTIIDFKNVKLIFTKKKTISLKVKS